MQRRRDATLLHVSGWLRWFVVLTVVFLAVVFGLAFHANLSTPPQLSVATIWVLVIYLTYACRDRLEFLSR